MHVAVWKIPEMIGSLDDDDDDDSNDNDDDDDDDNDDDDELPSCLVWVLLLERAPAGPDHNAMIITINFIINFNIIFITVLIIIISFIIGIFCKIEVI